MDLKVFLCWSFVVLVLCNYEADGNEIKDLQRVRVGIRSSLRLLEVLNADIGKPLGLTLLGSILKEKDEDKMKYRFNGVMKMLFDVGTKNFRAHIKTFNETVQKVKSSQLREILQSLYEGQVTTTNDTENKTVKNEAQIKVAKEEKEKKIDINKEELNKDERMDSFSLLKLFGRGKSNNQL
ncbi:UNVERIFIED_CONTAM: hypothetical protein RMT77_005861 [Armadillidium vulgare]